MTYLFDTNVLSYIIQKNENVLLQIEKILSQPHAEAKISLVVYYEIMRGLKVNSSGRKLQIFRQYCKSFDILGITERTMDIASDIYASLSADGNIIEDADIFIAATSIEYGFTLLTNNTEHMKRVKDLRFVQIEK